MSLLVEALNDRFGMNLTDADRIWFEQQRAHLGAVRDIQEAAQENDFEQFRVYVEPRFEESIIDRHEENQALVKAFFDKPEFRELAVQSLARQLFDMLRSQAG